MPSLSRPSVSNDNPYSESLFKTLKYRPAYPLAAFDTLFPARGWVAEPVRWYNHEHRHSSIRFVTPTGVMRTLTGTSWIAAQCSTKLRANLHGTLGVDLTQTRGLGPYVALKLVAECGNNMSC
jgi:hypothetical protein